jgi:hypothetical protein
MENYRELLITSFERISKMYEQSERREESPTSSLSKFIKRIWYVSLAGGAIGVMLQQRFVVKGLFWIISISTLLLAFSCAVMLVNKAFKLEERILYTLATLVLMFVAPHWLDIPAYLTHNYKVVEGVPTEFEYKSPYKAGSYLQVKIRSVELKLPKSVSRTDSDKWFVIRYLPNSKFILNYKILTKEETLEKK